MQVVIPLQMIKHHVQVVRRRVRVADTQETAVSSGYVYRWVDWLEEQNSQVTNQVVGYEFRCTCRLAVMGSTAVRE